MIIHWESLVWPKELQQLEHDVKHQRVKLQARELQPPDCDYDEAHLLEDKAQPRAFEGVFEALQPLDGEVQQCQPLGEDTVSQPLEGEETELRFLDGEVMDLPLTEDANKPQPMGCKCTELQVSNIENKKLPSFDGNGQELNPHDAKTRESGPLESKTQVDLESFTDLEVPQESECVHLEAHGGTEISNSKFTNQTNVAAESSQYNDRDASPASVTNYYARKLLHSFSMFAVDNGKIVLRKEATPTSITSGDSFVRESDQETQNSLVTYGTKARKSTLIKKYFGYFGCTHPSPWKNYSSNQFSEESHGDRGENSPLPLVPFQKHSTSSEDLLTIGRRWLSLRWKRVFSSKSLTRQKIPCSVSKQPMRHSSMAIHHDEKHDDNSAQKDDELPGTKGEDGAIQLAGTNAIVYYSTYVFRSAGMTASMLRLSLSFTRKIGLSHKERQSAGKSTGASHHQHAMSYDALGRVFSSYMTEHTSVDAVSEKTLGNEYFKQKKFNEAIDCYSRSIAFLPPVVAYANRAMAYLKIKRFQEAEGSCTEAINLDDHYVKAFSPRATARKKLGKLKESMDDADFALRLEPDNVEIKKQFAEFHSVSFLFNLEDKLRTKTLERRMIPKAILSKMGKYDIELEREGVSVKVEVLDSAELISSWIIDRLKRRLQEEEPIIVGLDLHASKNRWGNCSANSLLVICINDVNCLIVQLKYVDKIPENLKKFLSDGRICFVGVGVDWKVSRGVLPSLGPLVCKMTELSHLAARIRKKPSYCNSNLKALAAAYGVPYEPPALWGYRGGRRINYEARVFSKEEVKTLVHDASVCYKIGQKLVKELHLNDTIQETQELPGDEKTRERQELPTEGPTQETQELPCNDTTQETPELLSEETTQDTQVLPGKETTQDPQELPGEETTQGIIQDTQELPGKKTTQGTTQETQELPGEKTIQGTTQKIQELPGDETTQGTQ
ncbi:hypothetical protein Nepgr_033814 [Nepenthes gracilis]|uniref:Uncharacterized protein n=1 Tax=Nepenthes gracilis TaxID=150966 RepID=A0AAD3TL39_NEPGR|nr:hypothetical protein Nepgr_033814 [Nepenthes gracilis]